MTIKCPKIATNLIISDDPQLAAQLSCVLAAPDTYLPVLEGPRMTRSDSRAEVARRQAAVIRARPDSILLAGLEEESCSAIAAHFGPALERRLHHVAAAGDLERTGVPLRPPLVWGRDRTGVGLLKALRAGSGIVFEDQPSPLDCVPPGGEHLVVCEAGDEFSQVIAANYAYALRAGLVIVPEVDEAVAEDTMEEFYSLYARADLSPASILTDLRDRLRGWCGELPLPARGSVTFITGGLPFGFAFPEVPTTHLFRYPDLGTAIVNGFAAEQPDTPGIQFAALVDPATTDSAEIEAAESILAPRGVFVRTYPGSTANVTDIGRMIELLPYDLLLIATHCGDAPGYRWTYDFVDSEERKRHLVVDIALGVGRLPDPEMLAVTQFQRFVSLDGVPWNDRVAKAKLHVGTALMDYLERTKNDELQPSKKETVERVIGSSALAMYGGSNLIILPRPLAADGTPIVINNACVSWHMLAGNFTFSNARAYIGTLRDVMAGEAQEVVVRLLERHFQKPLPAALWSAQRDVYSDDPARRPYVATGVYTQWLRARRQDVVGHLVRRLQRTLASWERLTEPDVESNRYKAIQEAVGYYRGELSHFLELKAQEQSGA